MESMIDIITILTLVKICNISDKFLIIFIYPMMQYYMYYNIATNNIGI
jgi:hypothetical protein